MESDKNISLKEKYLVENIRNSQAAIKYYVHHFISKETDPSLLQSLGKAVVMELWAIRSCINKLNDSTTEFDTCFSKNNMEGLRHAAAHIDERLCFKIIKNFKVKDLIFTNGSFAGGSLVVEISTNKTGLGRFKGHIKRMINVDINGEKGFMAIFGIINNYIFCNSDKETFQLEINDDINKKLSKVIDNALKTK